MKNACFTAVFVASLALAACGQDSPVSNQPSNIVGEIEANREVEAMGPDGALTSAAPTAADSDTTATTPRAIPVALHGRWGLSPADCTSSRGDAKGLLMVGADAIRFYESVARPTRDLETTADSASGLFAFTGEGQQWTRHQALQVRGEKLTRTEQEPMRSYTYARC